MSCAVLSPKDFLHRMGMRRDRSMMADSAQDYMTFCQFNDSTLAYDDEGNGWSARGRIDLTPHFSLREMEMVQCEQ